MIVYRHQRSTLRYDKIDLFMEYPEAAVAWDRDGCTDIPWADKCFRYCGANCDRQQNPLKLYVDVLGSEYYLFVTDQHGNGVGYSSIEGRWVLENAIIHKTS